MTPENATAQAHIRHMSLIRSPSVDATGLSSAPMMTPLCGDGATGVRRDLPAGPHRSVRLDDPTIRRKYEESVQRRGEPAVVGHCNDRPIEGIQTNF